jgi:hypothetical protein
MKFTNSVENLYTFVKKPLHITAFFYDWFEIYTFRCHQYIPFTFFYDIVPAFQDYEKNAYIDVNTLLKLEEPISISSTMSISTSKIVNTNLMIILV